MLITEKVDNFMLSNEFLERQYQRERNKLKKALLRRQGVDRTKILKKKGLFFHRVLKEINLFPCDTIEKEFLFYGAKTVMKIYSKETFQLDNDFIFEVISQIKLDFLRDKNIFNKNFKNMISLTQQNKIIFAKDLKLLANKPVNQTRADFLKFNNWNKKHFLKILKLKRSRPSLSKSVIYYFLKVADNLSINFYRESINFKRLKSKYSIYKSDISIYYDVIDKFIDNYHFKNANHRVAFIYYLYGKNSNISYNGNLRVILYRNKKSFEQIKNLLSDKLKRFL